MYLENHKRITEEDFQFANLIWYFLSIRDQIKKADLIFVLCSHDLRVAKYAALLFKQGYAKHILFSGGLNFFTKNIFTKSEAESFADVAISEEVPQNSIFVENKSTNTGENILFSKRILKSLNLEINTIIALQKPSMTLRIKLALEKQWSEPKFYISSPSYPLAYAPHTYINLFLIINEIVGDLQRILEYPKLGYQSEILVPKEVIQAYHFLIDNGYDLHLCNGNRNFEFK